MKWLVVLFLFGCGGIENAPCYIEGKECPSAEQGEKGDSGDVGERGERGRPGITTTRIIREVRQVPAPSGGESVPTPVPGPPGPTGIPGKSCSVVEIPDGAVIICEDGTSAEIHHGDDCKGKHK